jgi:hypothetical protein
MGQSKKNISKEEKKHRLKVAAERLLDDYLNDAELTFLQLNWQLNFLFITL